ncbi:MAG: ABC transporter permease, partial [Sandarakinorhabdus sp.]|nr:ABC transporter permease [Sandarakinorhabdus sp.]
MRNRAAIPVTAARWMIAGEWRAHPARLVVGALAIAVGVALGFAVHLVNRSALASFDTAMRSVNGAADLQVRGVTPRGFAEALYPRLAHIPGIAAVSPVVELSARSGAVVAPGSARAGTGRITLIGIDILRAAVVTPALVGVPVAGRSFDPDAIFVSRGALRAMDARIGDRVTIVAAGTPQRFTVRGLLTAGDDQPIAVIDIADAQWRFGQLGRLNRIDLRLAEGADRDAVTARIAAILPPDAEIGSPASDAQRSDSLSRAYRVNLEMLAMVALLTGGFLVFSAQSLSVARRRPQFALLRVLGLKRRALVIQVVVEGSIVGVIGAGLGIAMGHGLAGLAISLLGGDLGSGAFGNHRVDLAFAPVAASVFAAIGIAVAIAASLVPAREAARAQPAIALKTSGDAGDPRRRPRGAPGLVLVGLGGLASLAPPIAGLPLAGYAAMALLH